MSTTSTGSSSPRSPPSSGGVPHSARDVQETLLALGVAPSRRYGQSFLVDPFIADAEAALAVPEPGLTVTEIGGGLGILSEALLRRRPGALTIIERDRRLADHLRRTFGDRISVVVADAVVAPLPPADVVVGNLPFSVGTPILLRLFASSVPRVVALLQKEVVDRLCASPGSKVYGRLTVLAALFGHVEPFLTVPSRAFEPAPEVEGRLVEFRRRTDALPVPSLDRFESMTAALFRSRRKQLRNLLPQVVGSGADPREVARKAAWPEDWERRRPEELEPDAFFRLARVLHERPSPRGR